MIPWNLLHAPDHQMQISGKQIVEIQLQLLHFLPGNEWIRLDTVLFLSKTLEVLT